MSGLLIDVEKCIGCARCVRACGNAGIEVEGPWGARKARATDGCILCGACVDACPVDALSIERGGTSGPQDLDEYRDYWVFAQVDEAGRALDVALELVGKARSLADGRGCRVVACSPRVRPGRGRPDLESALPPRESVDGPSGNAALLISVARMRSSAAVTRASPPSTPRSTPSGSARWCASAGPRRCSTERRSSAASSPPPSPSAFRRASPRIARCWRSIRKRAFSSRRARRSAETSWRRSCAPRIVLRWPRCALGSSPLPSPMGPASGRSPTSRSTTVSPACAPTRRRALLGGRLDNGCRRPRGRGSRHRLEEEPRYRPRSGRCAGRQARLHAPIVEAGWCDPWRQVGQTGVSVAPRLLIRPGGLGGHPASGGHVWRAGGHRRQRGPDAPIFASAQYKVVGDCVKVAEELLARL